MIWCCVGSLSVVEKSNNFYSSLSLLFLFPPLANELQGDHDQVLSAIVWNNSLFCEVKVRHWISRVFRICYKSSDVNLPFVSQYEYTELFLILTCRA